MITILRTPCFFIDVMALATESAMRRFGVSGEGAEKGESDTLRAFKVTTTASGVVQDVLLAPAMKALSMSEMLVGVPSTIVRLSCGWRALALRIRAVT